jgi:hypothetical protein
MNAKSISLSLLLTVLIGLGISVAQTGKSYHFIYVNINNTEPVALQDYLSNLYKTLGDQVCVFYLSNRGRPVIATDEKSFEALQASISNINNENTDLPADVDGINRCMSDHDFLALNTGPSGKKGVSCMYTSVNLHFFVDPDYFVQRNFDKYLIKPLLKINYDKVSGKQIKVNVYVDANKLKNLQKQDPDAFSKNEFNLIKY